MDADISIFFLAHNGVLYRDYNTDPLFGASLGYTGFIPDHPIGSLACKDQYQICNPSRFDNGRCTELTSWISLLETLELRASELGLNRKQTATFNRLIRSLRYVRMYYAVLGRNSAALQGM